MRGTRLISLGLADKSPLVLAGLRQLFAGGEFELVVTATDGERFLDAVRRFAFDVGVIGWEMPYMGGREVLEALAGCEDAPRIVVYTGSADPGAPREAMRLGAAGFVGKQEPTRRLLDAVRAVAEGRMYFPFLRVAELARDPLAALTPREQQLLAALGSGRTNAQLARELGVSVNTVKFHLRNLFEKIGARNRAHAVEIHLRRSG